MRVDYADFRQRADRYAYLVRTFGTFLAGQVLDVGCDQAYLRDVLGKVRYTGIDVSGNPDIHLNLEETKPFTFRGWRLRLCGMLRCPGTCGQPS